MCKYGTLVAQRLDLHVLFEQTWRQVASFGKSMTRFRQRLKKYARAIGWGSTDDAANLATSPPALKAKLLDLARVQGLSLQSFQLEVISANTSGVWMLFGIPFDADRQLRVHLRRDLSCELLQTVNGVPDSIPLRADSESAPSMLFGSDGRSVVTAGRGLTLVREALKDKRGRSVIEQPELLSWVQQSHPDLFESIQTTISPQLRVSDRAEASSNRSKTPSHRAA